MARTGAYARQLADHIIDRYKEGGEPIVLSGEEIKSILNKDLYNNALVEVRRAVVFQPAKNNKIIIPVRGDKGGAKSMQGYTVVDKDKFDIDSFGYKNVRGMSTKLVRMITDKYKAKTTDPTMVLRMLTVADTLYRRGSTTEFREVPDRLIAACILEPQERIEEYYIPSLRDMEFIETKEESRTLLTGQTVPVYRYKIKVEDKWLEDEINDIKVANGRPIFSAEYAIKSDDRPRLSRKSAKILGFHRECGEPKEGNENLGPKAQVFSKNLLTAVSNDSIMFSESFNKGETGFNEAVGAFRIFSDDALQKIQVMAEQEIAAKDKAISEKDEEIRRLKERVSELEARPALDEETRTKVEAYDALAIRAKKLVQINKDLEERSSKRFGDYKDLNEAKKRVLDSLQNIMEGTSEKIYRLAEECEKKNNFSTLRLKAPALIMDMGMSIESLFKRKS